MSVVTRRLSAPKPPKSRRSRKKPPTPAEEIRGFFSKNGWALIPLLLALWLAMVAAILATVPYGKLYLLAGALGMAAWIHFYGHNLGVKFRRPYPHHHLKYQIIYKWHVFIYAYALVFIAYVWATLATLNGKPSYNSLGMLVCLSLLCPAPWWYHRRVRGSVLVTFKDLPRQERDARLIEVQRRLIDDWTGFTSAGHVQGCKLRAVVFDKWSVSIYVYLRRGANVFEFTHRRRGHLNSACPWKVPPNAVRVQGDDEDARAAIFRYMLVDPHAQLIKSDPDERPTLDAIIIGLFETGADVLFELANTLIAGLTRSGKSSIINRLIQVFAKMDNVAMVGADFTEGATELLPWKDVFHRIATNREEFAALLIDISDECDRRGRIMAEKGWKVFRCTKDDPFMVFFIDEASAVKQFRLHGHVKEIAAKIGKYGGIIIVATQYPTAVNLPKEITANLPQKIGLMTDGDTADRVIFGATATKLGFSPSALITNGRKGSFLIKNSFYSRPMLARAFFVDEDDVTADVQRYAPRRTLITGMKSVRSARVVEALVQGDTMVDVTDDIEIVDAIELTLNEQLVLDAIDSGVIAPKAISDYTKIPSRTTSNTLKSLKAKGLVLQQRDRGGYQRA